MRVLVCGGRDYKDRSYLFAILSELHLYGEKPFSLLIEGGAQGADAFARQWAERMNVQVLSFQAEWTRLGKKAGPIRNARMILEGKPELVVAFPGGTGTEDLVRRARVTEIRIIRPEAASSDELPDPWSKAKGILRSKRG